MKELTKEMEDKLSELITLIGDDYLCGKPAILATGLFYSTEKHLIDQINKIETTFKD